MIPPDLNEIPIVPDVQSGIGKLAPNTVNLAIDIVSFFQVNAGTYSSASNPTQEFDIPNARYVSLYNRSRFPFYARLQPINGQTSLEYMIEPYQRHDINTDFSLAKVLLTLQMGVFNTQNQLGPVSVSDSDSGDSYNAQNAPSGRIYILAADRGVHHIVNKYEVNPRINLPLSGIDAGSGVTLDPSTVGVGWSSIMSILVANPGSSNVTVTFTLATGTTRTVTLPAGQYALPVECKKVAVSGQTGTLLVAFSSYFVPNF
jgi:hypothetical protein